MAKKSIKPKPREKTKTEVDLIELKKILREKIEEEFGSVTAFVESPEGQKLGGKNARSYLYAGGSVSTKFFNAVLKRYNMGSLKKVTKVERKTTYVVEK